MTARQDYEALGRQHGRAEAERCLKECMGRGSAFRDQWWEGFVTGLEDRAEQMQAEGVAFIDALAFIAEAREALFATLQEFEDKLEEPARAARMNRKARRAAKAKGLH